MDRSRERVLYTPTSPTVTRASRSRSRSQTRRRSSIKALRRPRSRSSRNSRGRVSRCSPNQPERPCTARSRRSSNRAADLERDLQQRASRSQADASTSEVQDHGYLSVGARPDERRSRSRLRRSSQRAKGSSRSRSRGQRSHTSPDHDSRRSRRRSPGRHRRPSQRSPDRRSHPSNSTARPDPSMKTGESPADSFNATSITDLVSVLKAMASNSLNKLGSMNNTVPEFDPCKREQTMTMWIHKVNECATIYGWSEQQIVHFALPKLKGVAQRWYEGLPSVLFTWSEWQEKLLAAFPSEENYGQMLSDMLAKRARFNDSLEEYYYEKLSLINRCAITGKRAVECILHGIDDRSVRLGAEAAQFDDPNRLLSYLRNVRNVKQNLDRKSTKGFISRQPGTVSSSKLPRCGNCKKDGHFTSQCTQPIKKCTRCGRIGHEVEQCYAKVQPEDKAVMRVDNFASLNILNETPKPSLIKVNPSEKYFKTAKINGHPLKAFIDFGSECSMIKLSCFQNIDSKYRVDGLPNLRGFGNSIVSCIGKQQVRIEIDGVEANLDLLIVPDDVMSTPVIIGQTFTEQPHVVVTKTGDTLEISQLSQSITTSNKINLYCSESCQSVGISIIEVDTNSSHRGQIFVEGGLRVYEGVSYYVLSGLFEINEDGKGYIVINNTSSTALKLPQGLLIARGRIAHEDTIRNVKSVSTVKNLPAITESDINVGPDLTFHHKTELLNLLNDHRNCFAFDLTELGTSTVGEMRIDLHDNEPVVYRPYRLSINEKEKVRDMISELLENGIIRPSTSSYASPIVVVRKKTGELRLCIDYRALNKKTVKENYPMPLIDDQLDVLSGNKYFTTLDLTSGYYQIPIKESDKHKTGFVTPDGHYEFNRMPFGLANAPATFQRIMNQVLGPMRHKEALAYLDDIIIPSDSIDSGIKKLAAVLDLFSKAGLTLKLSKCTFFSSSVDYLGFEVTSEGIRPGSRKVEAVEHFPVPLNQHNVRQFLGLASFFRRFVPHFSVIAKPLTSLLKKDAKWLWGPEQEEAFRKLQSVLLQRPILALYNPNATTELHTDACKIGIAGILLQRDEHEKLKPIAYFSRQTTPEEQNYSSYDLETLAVVSSLQKFRVYLIGLSFKIITDCNSLRATFQKRDMIPRVARWWEQMQEFNFSIEYRPGQLMAHVDALSRNPIQESCKVLTVENTDWLTTVQSADSEVQRIVGILKDPEMDNVVDIKTNFKLKNNRLFRITPNGDRWVVPKGVRWQILKQNHDDIGHFSLDKTLERIQATYWFARMRNFVKKYIKSCLECAYSKVPGGKRPGELHPIKKVDTPFDTIHADHVGPFVRSARGNMYILALIDSFTRYIYLKPVRNTKAFTTIRVFKEYFGIFGVPRRIITDRGACFTSGSFKNFVQDRNIKHVLNAVATPRANGQVERYNRTLVESLTAKCVGSAENKWDDYLPDVQWGLNNTFNKGINRTPSEALFGIRPSGINDSRIMSELADDVSNSSDSQNLSEIRDEINTHIKAYQEAQKKAYDEKRCPAPKYNVGDLVRVERQIPASGSSKKLVPKFQGPYRIVKVLDYDRYQIEDTPLTRKSNRSYSTIVAVDKIRPWLNFSKPHVDSSSDEE